MTIDSTFWVAVSFFIFFGGLIYLKVPNKINEILNKLILDIKNEIDESEQLRTQAKTLLDNAQSKLNTVQVQRYTPDNPYFQVGNAPTPPEPSPNGGQSETGESTPTVPNSPDSSIAPDDASNVGQFTDI